MDVIIDIAALVLLGGLLISWLWRRNIANKAKSWPIAEAVIESGTVETVEQEKFSKVDLPVFSFSYRVEGEYFSGRFALLPYITDPGESVIKRMIGRNCKYAMTLEIPSCGSYLTN